MKKPEQWIVATDLDATLLDHDTYSWEAARNTLQMLKEAGIPVVLASSKTAAEMRTLREEMKNEDAFLAENGGFAALPNGDEIILGQSRIEILDAIDGCRPAVMTSRGFSQMTTEEISRLTGLTMENASQAADRQTSEPIYWQDSETVWTEFSEALHSRGLRTAIGGRFRHVMGETSKALAIKTIADWYEKQLGRDIRVLALGDSENDAEMLSEADCAIWIRKRGATPSIDLKSGGRCSVEFGPQGWADCVMAFFASLGILRAVR